MDREVGTCEVCDREDMLVRLVDDYMTMCERCEGAYGYHRYLVEGGCDARRGRS